MIPQGVLETARHGRAMVRTPSASRSALPKHAGAALALAVFVAVFDTFMNVGNWPAPPNDRNYALEWLGYDLVICPSFALSLFAAALAAERATARGVPYGVAWSVAVVAGCLFATVLQWVVLNNVFDWNVLAPGHVLMVGSNKADWTSQQPAYMFLMWSIPASLAAILYAHWRRAAQVRSRLYGAEVGRAETERQVLEARLQATQARVEPQFLFDTLARVKTLHASNPGQATAQLDSLIAYLRAALPRLNDTRSTLSQELDLCRAYLDIEKIARGKEWSFTIDAPEALASASMPAMVLLPLLARTVACAEPSVAQSLTLRAGLHHDRLRITLHNTAMGTDVGSAVPRDVRERLLVLYGARADIKTDRAADGSTRVVLEIPFGMPGDSADRTARA